MTYAKFTEDGALDWTSSVPQEGLEAVHLPLVNAGDEIIRDGRGRISVRRKERGMTHTSSPSFSVLSSSLDNCAADAYLLALSSYAPPAETGGEKVSGISVLIPCYGKAAYIEETVASVLAQDEMPEEIKILLMDGKSAEKKERLEGMSPVVRCTVSGKLDVCEARNRLARECGTEWFVFLDADDMLAPGFIRTLSSSGADFIFPAYRILRNGKTEDPDTSGMNAPCVSGNLTGLFRRDAFLALGGLDGGFAVCGREDTDFILTVLESGRTVRAEKNSFYILRRDDGDTEWTASSFTHSETYKNRSRESADKILAKHREGIKKNFRTRGVFTGCHMPTEETVLLRRYAETGDDVHLLYLLTQGKMQGRDVIVRQTVARFFGCTGMDFRTACPGRDFSLCPEFDGDFSQWVFVNCDPTEEERARISDHCMGMSFDVLFLSAPVDQREFKVNLRLFDFRLDEDIVHCDQRAEIKTDRIVNAASDSGAGGNIGVVLHIDQSFASGKGDDNLVFPRPEIFRDIHIARQSRLNRLPGKLAVHQKGGSECNRADNEMHRMIFQGIRRNVNRFAVPGTEVLFDFEGFFILFQIRFHGVFRRISPAVDGLRQNAAFSGRNGCGFPVEVRRNLFQTQGVGRGSLPLSGEIDGVPWTRHIERYRCRKQSRGSQQQGA